MAKSIETIKSIALNKKLQKIASVVIIIATLVLFGWYCASNQNTLSALSNLSVASVVGLFIAYLFVTLANALVLSSSLALLSKVITHKESFSITAYSSVVNFFGPLQSGPGFRAAYLKAKHRVSLSSFAAVTVLFYLFFGAINACIILVAYLLREQSVVLTIAALVFGAVFSFALYRSPQAKRIVKSVKKYITNIHFWIICLGALGVSLGTMCAYFIELRTIDQSVSIAATTIYTAAANLSLFVSLTPGAIGFRETFLLFTQSLHHIPTQHIVAANILDRAFYVVFLLVLFLFTVSLTGKDFLTSWKSRRASR